MWVWDCCSGVRYTLRMNVGRVPKFRGLSGRTEGEEWQRQRAPASGCLEPHTLLCQFLPAPKLEGPEAQSLWFHLLRLTL